MDKRIPQPIEEQELTTKASVWQWGKDRARLPFCKCSQKSPKKSLKELPIGHDVFIEVSTHRQPLKGKLVLVDDPLLLSDSKSNPRFRVQGNEFTKSDILGWCRLEWKKSNWWSCIRRPIIPAVQAEWQEYAVVYRARHTFLRGALLDYNGSGWQWS